MKLTICVSAGLALAVLVSVASALWASASAAKKVASPDLATQLDEAIARGEPELILQAGKRYAEAAKGRDLTEDERTRLNRAFEAYLKAAPLSEGFPALRALLDDASLPPGIRADLLEALHFYALWGESVPPQDCLGLYRHSLELALGEQTERGLQDGAICTLFYSRHLLLRIFRSDARFAELRAGLGEDLGATTAAALAGKVQLDGQTLAQLREAVDLIDQACGVLSKVVHEPDSYSVSVELYAIRGLGDMYHLPLPNASEVREVFSDVLLEHERYPIEVLHSVLSTAKEKGIPLPPDLLSVARADLLKRARNIADWAAAQQERLSNPAPGGR